MKKCLWLTFILFAGCQQQFANDTYDNSDYSNIQTDNTSVLEPDGYGLGVHKNRYGQPVRVEPDFGGVQGERLKIKTDGYGMGVHMDQYGRPVREKSWP